MIYQIELLKEEILFNNNILNNKSEVNKQYVYDPNNIPNRTQKEDLVFNDNVLNNRADVNRSTSYNPAEIAKGTIKQMNVINERSSNIVGDPKSKMFNPSDIPKNIKRVNNI